MSSRSRARAVAFQVIYQDDLNPRNNPAITDDLIEKRLRSDEQRAFARELVSGTRLNRTVIDATIEQAAANWSLTRMAATDRNVLRLGVYELVFGTTPQRVAIDEAVDLAKRYGTAQSGQFVNGILDRVMHDREAETKQNS